MMPTKQDLDILGLPEMREMQDRYREKFGEVFPSFNYADFGDRDGKIAGQIYKEALEKALQDDKPYRIESKADILDDIFGHY